MIVFRINTNNHDRVTSFAKACAVAERSGIRRFWVDATAVVRAGKQKVFGRKVAFGQVPAIGSRAFRRLFAHNMPTPATSNEKTTAMLRVSTQ